MEGECCAVGCTNKAASSGVYCRACAKKHNYCHKNPPERERRVPSHLQYDGFWDNITKAYEEDR